MDQRLFCPQQVTMHTACKAEADRQTFFHTQTQTQTLGQRRACNRKAAPSHAKQDHPNCLSNALCYSFCCRQKAYPSGLGTCLPSHKQTSEQEEEAHGDRQKPTSAGVGVSTVRLRRDRLSTFCTSVSDLWYLRMSLLRPS